MRPLRLTLSNAALEFNWMTYDSCPTSKALWRWWEIVNCPDRSCRQTDQHGINKISKKQTNWELVRNTSFERQMSNDRSEESQGAAHGLRETRLKSEEQHACTYYWIESREDGVYRQESPLNHHQVLCEQEWKDSSQKWSPSVSPTTFVNKQFIKVFMAWSLADAVLASYTTASSEYSWRDR